MIKLEITSISFLYSIGPSLTENSSFYEENRETQAKEEGNNNISFCKFH